MGTFPDPLEHVARDGASVGQTGARELQETSFLQSLHVAQARLKHDSPASASQVLG